MTTRLSGLSIVRSRMQGPSTAFVSTENDGFGYAAGVGMSKEGCYVWNHVRHGMFI